MDVNWQKFKELGEKQIGKPYSFGVEDNLKDPDPKAFDCSELVEWLYAQVGVVVPDGSENQFEASEPTSSPKLGDVGFFRHPGKPTHHVGIFWDDKWVLEARGEPFNKVFKREKAKWDAWHEFSGWRRLKAVL